MKIDKEKLNRIAIKLSDSDHDRIRKRKSDRYWQAASAAIAAKILRKLKADGISRAKLAEKLGMTPANITRFLNGKCNFELRTLIEIERAIDVKIIDRSIIPTNNPEPVIIKISYSVDSDNSSYIAPPEEAPEPQNMIFK